MNCLDSTTLTTPRLRMSAVQKSFGATRALKNVSFEVAAGEVHALIGENGAGKSTLMKILSGAHRPDSGTVELDGRPFVPANPLHARRSGIAMIYQELTLAPHLSVEENILLGEEPARMGWLNRSRRRELARQALAQLRHESIPLEAPVNSRTIAEQQIVEIARALIGQPKVLIMDEPTSSLTQVDTENLFAVIERLRRLGVSIIYISHFLEECQRIATRYTVLRDGESVATGDMAAADLRQIIQWMVGREISDIYPRTPHRLGEPVLGIARAGRTAQTEFGKFDLARGRNPRSGRPCRRGAHGNIARMLWIGPHPGWCRAGALTRGDSPHAVPASRKWHGSSERESKGGRVDAEPQRGR